MHVLLLRGVSLLSVQVTRWANGEFVARTVVQVALEIRRAGEVVPKWNVGNAPKC